MLIIQIISVMGVVAFAVTGAIVAIDHRVDLFGVILMAEFTAFGGGVMRDLLMGNTPPLLFCDPFYFWLAGVAAVTAVVVFIIARIMQQKFCEKEVMIERVNNVVDALGLSVFVATSTGLVMTYMGEECNAFLALALATITGVGGGMIRDVLLGEIPFVLKKRIYALAALSGAAMYYLMAQLGVIEPVAVLVGSFTTFALRMMATIFKWNIPKALK